MKLLFASLSAAFLLIATFAAQATTPSAGQTLFTTDAASPAPADDDKDKEKEKEEKKGG